MAIDKISKLDLPAIPVWELLEVLLERSRQHRKDPGVKIPKVTVGLSDGSRLVGHLVDADLKGDRKSNCVLIQLEDAEDLAYMQPSMVSWVVVHQSSGFLEQLAAGRIDSIRFIDPPGMTQLERNLKDLSAKLTGSIPGGLEVTVDWNSVDKESRRQMAALSEVLVFLDQTLTDLAAGEFAKNEIGKSIRSVRIIGKPVKEITLQDGVLSIEFPLEGDQNQRFKVWELGDRLNKLL
jgi:hypothetical protein